MGIKLHVKLFPNAKKEGLGGTVEHEGRKYLKIAVRAPAIEGKANAALIGFISSFFGIPKSEIEIASGLTGRHKTVIIYKENQEIQTIIEKLLNQ